MIQFLTDFFDSTSFMPHGHCFLWQPDILWLHVLSDAGIALAYFSIPLCLVYFVRKRKDFPFPITFLLFCAFILLCGTTHLMSIWVLWHPDYAIEGAIKALTAIVSISTFVVLARLIPKALFLTSSTELGRLNESLQRANSDLKILHAQNRESDQMRLRTVVDNVVDGIVTFDKEGVIESFNPACERIFGYTSGEATGKNVTALIPEHSHDKIHDYLKSLVIKATNEGIADTYETHGKRKDDSIFPIDLSISAFQLEGESHFLVIARDITQRKEEAKTREQLRHAQKMESLGQLTGGIAHDFNNILAIILGNLDFMSERTESDDPLRIFITPSIEAAEHGAGLTKQLLAFSRKQALQPKIISVHEMLSSFSAMVRLTLGERIEVILAQTEEVCTVNVDPSQLQNALLNLAMNARDAMPEGGKLILETQNVDLDEDYSENNDNVAAGNYVVIAVSDTGEGMTQDVIDKAFEPFFTTKEVGKGSGLGLSMVYGFVKQSQGHIKLYSEPNHGTSIKIYLPRVQGAPLKVEDFKPKLEPVDDKSIIILVVEDNKNVLAVTASMVESLGYNVLQAETGDAALKILEARSDITFLLTDVMLPGIINGPALAKHAVALHPNIKILFNSGYAEQAIVQSGMLEEGVNLISKPFRKQQLANKINEILKQP